MSALFRRAHYARIAAAIKPLHDGGSPTTLARVVAALAAALQADNPKFNPAKFAAACGTGGDYDA
jgi:hypothetical protein